ncbi:DUF421 domain-containing protein [Microvirga sp. M2]|uniref:DUF421 domain-containing protein n=1 Tax=Microvirga sp. M2 TaxID=3073270 RepID=UPI0039C39BEE
MVRTIVDEVQLLLGLGLDVGDVNSGQMALRALAIYAIMLVLAQLASKRFLSKASAFDVIVAIMLGSIMSRAINGSAPFLPTVAASAALLALHWLFATLAVHTSLGALVKGEPCLLIKDGEIQEDGMRKAKLSENDLQEALRLHADDPDPSKIKRAYLERNGRISIIPFRTEPKVLDVSVEDGVKTIRIKLE